MTYAMGLPRCPLAAFLAFFFLALASSSREAASCAPESMSMSSAAVPRRDRLPVGRTGCVTTEPVPSGSSLTACLSSVFVGHLPVSTPVEYSVEQGRQDLNLQPAVLETAALPVELRPFKPGAHTICALPVRSLGNRWTARWTGKTPRSECSAPPVLVTNPRSAHSWRRQCAQPGQSRDPTSPKSSCRPRGP